MGKPANISLWPCALYTRRKESKPGWPPSTPLPGSQDRYCTLCPPAPNHTTDGPPKQRIFNDTAARAARWLVGFDDDLPSASSDGDGNDAVVGQVEEDGGSVGCDPDRLVQGSWSCSRLNA
jgi:hypothetical protein